VILAVLALLFTAPADINAHGDTTACLRYEAMALDTLGQEVWWLPEQLPRAPGLPDTMRLALPGQGPYFIAVRAWDARQSGPWSRHVIVAGTAPDTIQVALAWHSDALCEDWRWPRGGAWAVRRESEAWPPSIPPAAALYCRPRTFAQVQEAIAWRVAELRAAGVIP
jgi:hypothetical protein